MQLPDGEKSLWREAYNGPVYPAIAEDIQVDVSIIGAGITGLTTGYLLKEAGFTVAVLDKDTVGGGTTGRTTGKVTSQHGLIYHELSKSLGMDKTRLYAEANEAAVAMVDSIILQENIDCDWQRDDNFVYTADPAKVQLFQQEAKIAADLGLPASFVSELPLPFEIKGAVKFTDQGKFASEKYLLGLAKAVHGNGSFVFEKSRVSGIHDGNPCRVTAGKAKVISKSIIIATNVPTLPLIARGGYCIMEYPTESYIISGPYNGEELKGMYISPDKGHYSILPVELNGERRLLIGGGGHLSGMRVSKDRRFNRLAKYAEGHFGVTSFTHKWSDRDYISYDKVPLIGKLYPWSKHLYVGTAYKKWGLSSGTMAAMILTDTISGKDNHWAPVFTPQRLKPITSIPKAVLEQVKQLTSP
jgi:glycine/D-amino acid oxidase-like deaminating enzyme